MSVGVSSSRGRTATASQSLRQMMDARRAHNQTMALDEAIAIIVPLCLDVQTRHSHGESIFLHPGCVLVGADGLTRFEPTLASSPSSARDRVCLAPELQAKSAAGNARASVFSIGAMLYEMVTGATVGPGMRRPKEIDPTLPSALEALLAKALVANPQSRPDDLGALASAMHHIAPMKSIPPPEVDAARLDKGTDFEVDIRLSMIPMSEAPPAYANAMPEIIMPNQPAARNAVAPAAASSPAARGGDPLGNVVDHRPTAPKHMDATTQLAQLKHRLESDVRPRYVVNKDKMDHGPFSAVELLQQIASNQFTEDHDLRDELSGQTKKIGEWEEFAPFAENAKLTRQVAAEKKEVVRLEKSERTSGALKFIIGGVAVVLVAAVAVVFIVKARGSRNEDTDILDDPNALALNIDGGIAGRRGHGGGRGSGHGGGNGGGGFSAGMSYEAAIAQNNTDISIGGPQGGNDLTNAQLAAPMNNAAFIGACGAPDSMKVTVRVAIKFGRAVGVSVSTNPPNGSVASCIDHHVRGISWPQNGKMDSFTTTY